MLNLVTHKLDVFLDAFRRQGSENPNLTKELVPRLVTAMVRQLGDEFARCVPPPPKDSDPNKAFEGKVQEYRDDISQFATAYGIDQQVVDREMGLGLIESCLFGSSLTTELASVVLERFKKSGTVNVTVLMSNLVSYRQDISTDAKHTLLAMFADYAPKEQRQKGGGGGGSQAAPASRASAVHRLSRSSNLVEAFVSKELESKDAKEASKLAKDGGAGIDEATLKTALSDVLRRQMMRPISTSPRKRKQASSGVLHQASDDEDAEQQGGGGGGAESSSETNWMAQHSREERERKQRERIRRALRRMHVRDPVDAESGTAVQECSIV